MAIKIHYFANFRELAKCESEEMEFSGTHGELYTHVSKLHGFSLPSGVIQVAANDEFTSMDSIVISGSKVVFIPPVAGG